MTPLDFFDMYLVVGVMFDQYLCIFSQYLFGHVSGTWYKVQQIPYRNTVTGKLGVGSAAAMS